MTPTTGSRRPHNVPGGGSALKPPPLPAPPPVSVAAPSSGWEQPPAAAAIQAGADVPPPPPLAVQRHSREQFNSKIRIDLRRRLNRFVAQHNSTLQGVLEAALDEYMERRGWSWEDYQRAERNG